jgi:hypothetical protein
MGSSVSRLQKRQAEVMDALKGAALIATFIGVLMTFAGASL